ncbi:vacuolar fusion protein MON1 homolog A isoform X2 [Saimiri boliviensis]|uniref:vacuolar fusion protein MON1 homolog A isoform X2 n=1 Tax=Saimiri boliviensis TaxID=27679 RepID=UPI000533C97C|nr:vacuolar fusion protein MON1 homolog A isoform X3 [Saimiri boliviensis boliviensis]
MRNPEAVPRRHRRPSATDYISHNAPRGGPGRAERLELGLSRESPAKAVFLHRRPSEGGGRARCRRCGHVCDRRGPGPREAVPPGQTQEDNLIPPGVRQRAVTSPFCASWAPLRNRRAQRMATDMQRKRSSECPDGTLTPSDGRSVERAESPTPGLAQGMEPDGYKVVFVRRSPLVLVAVARTRQSAQELAQELLYIYYQILSLLTGAQLSHIFQQKQNYDLRRLLSGSERITDNLLQLMARDPSFLMGAARCLPLAAAVRDTVSASLQQARARSLVFSILLARNQLVALVRRKDQFLHPIDLHLLFNLISSSSSFREGEAWTPVCLPKFNAAGFFHAHISYLEPDTDLCLLLISTDREDFFAVSDCRRRFQERLRKRGAHLALREALRTPYYSVAQVGIPDLRHFLYKSKSSGLFTSPEIEAPYTSEEEQERLLGLYQYLHSRAHNASRPLKTIYYMGPNENLLAWVTGAFELYMCYSPLGTKASAVSAIHKLMRWIRKEEDRLFILTPLTY